MKINALGVISHHVLFMHVPDVVLQVSQRQTLSTVSKQEPAAAAASPQVCLAPVCPSSSIPVLLGRELAGHPSSPAGWSRAGGAPLPWRLLLLPHKV